MKKISIFLVFLFAFSVVGITQANAEEETYRLNITVTNKNGATGNVTGGEGSYPKNETVRLTANTLGDTVFNGWNNGPCSGKKNTCDVVMDKDIKVTANFTKGTSTTSNPGASSSQSRLTINKIGSGKVTNKWGAEVSTGNRMKNSRVAIVAMPATGYVFAGWEGGKCQGQGYFCEFIKGNSNEVETAKFTPTTNGKVTVTALAVNAYYLDETTGTITGANNPYNIGDRVTITAVPNSGKVFGGWYPYEGSHNPTNPMARTKCYGQGATCTFIADGNTLERAIVGTARDTTDRQFSVYYRPEGNGSGSVVDNNGVSYSRGSSYQTAYLKRVTFTATPSSGSAFAGWNGACRGQGQTCDMIVSGWFDLVPVFNLNSGGGTVVDQGNTDEENNNSGVTFRLDTTKGGDGSGTITPASGSYPNNTSVTITATPNSSSTFGGWGGACGGRKTTCTITMNGNKTVKANFFKGGTSSSDLDVYSSLDLEVGMARDGVITLQKYLNSNGYVVNTNQGEEGSVGYETNYFGEKTKQALIKFQKDKGISPAQGYFGPQTRRAMGM